MPAAVLTLLPVLIQYGLPAVQQLISMFNKPAGPTDADWQALMALTTKTARQQMLETLAAHGIDPNSPQGQAFLALTP